MTRMISTTVYLLPEQLKTLKKISNKTGTPQSVLIRRGVEFAINEALANIALRKGRGR